MADSVQYYLELMIPELKDLKKRKLFSSQEIQEIAKKRREFEYKLARRICQKVDFLRYIEYELALHSLKEKRTQRLGLSQKKTELDFSSLRRLYFIFDRAVVKFGASDVNLWLSYIEVAKANNSDKILSRVLSRAIQMHPRQEGFWILAAEWEFTRNANVGTARMLLQRAIRLNSDSKRLWREYYRLEWLFLDTIKKRRALLGLSTGGKEEPSTTPQIESKIDVPALPEENSEAALKLEDESSAKEAFLTAAIPKLVLTNAFKAFASDFAFFKEMLEITRSFPDSEGVQDFIYQKMSDNFQTLPECRCFLAERFISGYTKEHPEYAARLAETLSEYSTAIETLESKEMMELASKFVLALLDTFSDDEEMQSALENRIVEIFRHAEERDWVTETLYLDWISLYEKKMISIDASMREEVSATGSAVCNASLKKFPTSSALWSKRMELALIPFKNWNVEVTLALFNSLEHLFESAVKSVPGNISLWKTFLSFCQEKVITGGHLNQSRLESLVTKFLETKEIPGPEKEPFFYNCLFSLDNSVCDLVKVFKAVSETRPEPYLYRLWISACKTRGIRNAQDVRNLFERCLVLEPENVENWISFMSFEMTNGAGGNLKRLDSIYQRAKAILGESVIKPEYERLLMD